MLRKASLAMSVGLFALELALFGALFYAAHLLRSGPIAEAYPNLREVQPIQEQLPGIVTIVALSMACFAWSGFYGATWRASALRSFFGRIVVGFALAFMLSAVAALFLFREQLTRIAIVLGFAMAFLAFLVERFVVKLLLNYARRHGRNLRHIVIVGAGGQAAKVAELIRRHEGWGFRLAGYLDDGEPRGKMPPGVRALGKAEDLQQVLDERVVDRVFVAVPGRRLHEFESVVQKCEEVGVPVHVAADLFEHVLSQGRVEELDEQPILTFDRVDHPPFALALKRLTDVAVAAAALILLSPVLVLVALVVKLTSRGPVLFVQDRAGRNGRPFRIYKFRSMVADAEARKEDLKHLNELAGPAFKLRNDPRVTLVGRVLRRLSLDELPQLWSVLKGDMSLVGPRPLPVSEAQACERWQRRRQSMRPGLTCLWQVNGRSNITDFDQWAKLDLDYIDKWSLALDLKILLLTVPAVLKGSGAR